MIKTFNRLFTRGIRGTGTEPDLDNVTFERKLTKHGNSYKISVPPVLIEKYNLYDGVRIESNGEYLIISSTNKKE